MPTDERERLSDIVADGRFVVFTGAGISAALTVKGDPSRRLPQWPDLLRRLRREFAPALAASANADLDALLHDRATAEELIEAASVLADAVKPQVLDAAVRRHVATRKGQCTETHVSIAALEPRGIVTLNYDDGHEVALGRRKASRKWTIIPSATEEEALRAVVEGRFATPFLLKAHGSLLAPEGLVLSGASYRQLQAKAPTYRAFLRHLVTEFNFVFIGFGLQDPDFTQCLEEMTNAYGRPVRDHVLITRRPVAPASGKDLPKPYLEALGAREVFVRRRYGIRTLRVHEYTEIPKLLADTLTIDGPQIKQIVSDCLSRDIDTRRAGHRQLAALSANGKERAVSVFSRLTQGLLNKAALSRDEEFDLSELIYALGTISRMDAVRETLLSIAEQTSHKEVLAHALIALVPAVRFEDMRRLEGLADRCRAGGLVDGMGLADRRDRLPTYAATLIALAQARKEAAQYARPSAGKAHRAAAHSVGRGKARR